MRDKVIKREETVVRPVWMKMSIAVRTARTDRSPEPFTGHLELTEPFGTSHLAQSESPGLCSFLHGLHEEEFPFPRPGWGRLWNFFCQGSQRARESATGSRPRSLWQARQRGGAESAESNRGGKNPDWSVEGQGGNVKRLPAPSSL